MGTGQFIFQYGAHNSKKPEKLADIYMVVLTQKGSCTGNLYGQQQNAPTHFYHEVLDKHCMGSEKRSWYFLNDSVRWSVEGYCCLSCCPMAAIERRHLVIYFIFESVSAWCVSAVLCVHVSVCLL